MNKILNLVVFVASFSLSQIFSQQITVTSPNGGENWQTGTTKTITWIDNIDDSVSIDLIGNEAILNGDMELDANWPDLGSPTLNERSSEQVNNGTYSRKVITGNVGWNGIIQTNINFNPNEKYKLSFWIYSVGSTQIRYAVYDGVNDMFGNLYGGTGVGGQWEYVTKEFTTSASADNTGWIRLVTNSKVETFYIDDVSIQKITTIVSSTPSDGSKWWRIPYDFNEGTDYKIKITSVNNDSIYDLSDNNFTIYPWEISITSPNGGEILQTGTTHTITWNSNITNDIDIDLFKGGIFYTKLANNITSDGSFSWGIKDTLDPGSDYRVKIISVANDSVYDFSDADFTLEAQQITVTSPNGGESWPMGTTHNVTWNDNIDDDVDIDLFKGGVFYTKLANNITSDGSFNWVIKDTLNPGSDYRVKIISVANDSVYDFSDADFTLEAQQITVTSPNGGESWPMGTTHNVIWNDNIDDDVDIDLFKGGVFYTKLANNITSDGSFNWVIKDTLDPGSDYRIKIVSVANDSVYDFSDADFTLEAQQITVTSPNGGESWQTGTNHEITWNDNIDDDVDIDLFKGGVFYTNLANNITSDGSFNWVIKDTLDPGSDYRIKIVSVANDSVYDFSDNDFTLIAQQITVTSPNGGEIWQTGTFDNPITWNDNIDDDVDIDLFKGGVFYTTLANNITSDGSFNWDIEDTLDPGSDYRIKIISVANDSVYDFSDNDFTLIAQKITITSPNGGESWQTGTNHEITWNDNIDDDVDIDLFKGGVFYTKLANNITSDGSFNWDIEDTLDPGSDYRIKIISVANDSVYDFSDNDFTLIAQQITVTSPNGGEIWQTGTFDNPITWNDNIDDDVDIDLFKGGVFYTTLANNITSDGSFNWDIEDTLDPGSDYRIKIISVANDSVYDFSDNDFTLIAQQITVTSPNGGEIWQTGTFDNPITWNDNIDDDVDIDLFKGGVFYTTLANNITSDGSFNWDIEDTLDPGSDYRIKIISVVNDSVYDFSDNDFTLIAQQITVTSPNGGEIWQTGTFDNPITWNDNIDDDVDIDLFKGGVFYTTLANNITSDGSFNWDIEDTLDPGSDYRIKIISVVNDSVYDFSDNDFTLIAQQITVTSPNGGEIWQTGTFDNPITWNDNIDDDVDIDLFKGGVFYTTLANNITSDGSFNWDIEDTLDPGSDYRIKIISVANDSVYDFSDNDFTLIAQQITVTSPNGGEIWQTGTFDNPITWNDNIDDDVDIDLLKGGVFYTTLANNITSDGSFNWDIEDTLDPGSDYRVKIVSVANDSIYDFSDNDFTLIAQQITVTSPNGGEIWQTGTFDNPITWNDNIDDDVDIDLFKGGVFYTTLANNITSDGSFNWDIEDTLDPGSDYRIKIISVANDSVYDFSDADFTLIAQQITVTSPNGGESWRIGTLHTISWTDNIEDSVKIRLFKSDTLYSYISGDTPSDGTYEWTIPSWIDPGSDYKIFIKSSNNNNVFDYSDNFFTLFESEITVISPNGSESWQTGTTHTITWNDNFEDSVRIRLYKADTVYSYITGTIPSTGSYEWNIPVEFESGSNYRIYVKNDLNNEIYDFSDSTFSLYNPEVQIVLPNGGENWRIGTAETITWNDNFEDSVKIRLYKGDSLHTFLTGSIPSDGLYEWEIPNSIEEGNDYKIVIKNSVFGTVADTSDEYFGLFRSRLTVTSPNGGENIRIGTQLNITYTDNFEDSVKIRLYKSDTVYAYLSSAAPSNGSFNWTIPSWLEPGSDYRIYIKSTENSTVFDFSDSTFSFFESELTITSPNGSENWRIGTEQSITWIDDLDDSLRIRLYKSDTLHLSITGSTPSDGLLNWNIPNSLEEGSDYRIFIRSYNNSDVYDLSDSSFTLFRSKLTVISPNGGENFRIGTSQIITWEDNLDDSVKIRLYKSDTLFYSITGSTASDGELQWNIPSSIPPGSDYKIFIKSFNYNSVSDFSDEYFTLFESEITLSTPNGNESWRTGSTETITWNSNLEDSIKIRLYASDTLHSSITGSTANDGSYNWKIPNTLVGGTDYKILVRSFSDSDIYDLSDSNFTIYNPEITVLTPNGGEHWTAGTKQAIKWDDILTEDVKIHLYKFDTLYLSITGGTSSDGTFNWNIPNNIDPGNDYKIFIKSDVNNAIFDFSDDNFSIAPADYILMQNYPNPFNPETTIKYGIPETTGVLLEIFDVIGQRLKVLVDEEQEAGIYEVHVSSSGLSSGIYLYRIVAGDFLEMKKMILLK